MASEVADLIQRATADERAGQWASAISTYEEAFARTVSARDEHELLEVITRLGHCHRHSRRTDLAEEYFGLALEMARIRNDSHFAGRALKGLAILQQNQGEILKARETYLQARVYASTPGNDEILGEIEQNLGIIANIQGNLDEALQRYLAGLAHLEAAGSEQGCARVLNNLGMLHVDLRKLELADSYFQRAQAICARIGDIATAAIVHINRTELFLALGEPEKARASCDEGFEISSRLKNDFGKSEALKFYGIIYRETGKPHLAEIHLRQAIELASKHDTLLEAESQRELGLALRAQDKNREALAALNRSHTLFKQLQAQHDQADVNHRISNLEGDFLSLVRSWGESIEAKDRYTSGHCQRVADYACRIAQEAGIPEHEITWFRMGAFLHDVGKTEVPEEILNKPGRLTDEERLTMERHTVIGDEMLAPVEFPWDIRPIVRSHHERWDGTGYPDRLAGEAIPFTARILRIADIFDALTTTRSYREPLTPERAYEIMVEDFGSFDPDLFEIFRRLYPEFAESARSANSERDSEFLTAGRG
ncbi:MAG TPA: HD domain-containing phosphohydrolase [Longimicrobiaceae bacterium]|nr:HD domain-containing phosphohydrolase [Longimicrobiaceae bacterium]